MTKIYASASVAIAIPFHDVDMMGIVWHGRYAKYLEIARENMLETIDYNIKQMKASGYAWPVIEMNIRYAQPLLFEQKIRVQADLIEIENRMKIAYRIFDVESGRRLTKAYTVQVALDASCGEMLFASPAVLLEKFRL
jgi:acyl-CoA thioester hydrolase